MRLPVLTPQETKAVGFVAVALVVGFFTKQYRDAHPPPVPPAVVAKIKTSAKKRSSVVPQETLATTEASPSVKPPRKKRTKLRPPRRTFTPAPETDEPPDTQD